MTNFTADSAGENSATQTIFIITIIIITICIFIVRFIFLHKMLQKIQMTIKQQ